MPSLRAAGLDSRPVWVWDIPSSSRLSAARCALGRQSMISEPPLLVSSSQKQVRAGRLQFGAIRTAHRLAPHAAPHRLASIGPWWCPCCADLRLSRALLFEHGHGTGCREQALKVVSSDFDVYNIRATAITRWHNTHANLDPTNSPRQPSLSSEATHPSRHSGSWLAGRHVGTELWNGCQTPQICFLFGLAYSTRVARARSALRVAGRAERARFRF